MLSRQEGSTTRHLGRALVLRTGQPTGLANCQLDRVLTYKNLIYLLNLQIFVDILVVGY